MFVLGGEEEIGDLKSLVRAIGKGLEAARAGGAGAPSVVREGSVLTVDLTGCALRGRPLPVEQDGTAAGPEFPFAEIRLRGEPTLLGGTEVTLRARVPEARLGVARSLEGGERILAFRGAGDGSLEVHVAKEEIERRLREGLDARARGQGARILEVSLDMENDGPDGAALTLHLTLKMMFRARIRVSGVLRLRHDLELVVERAAARGEGMAGKVVAGLVAPQLASLTGKEFPLARLLPPGLAAGGASLTTEGGLGVKARLTAAAGENG